MQLLKLNPTTPGVRHKIKLSKNLLSKKGSIYKKLNLNNHRYQGRSAQTGHITSWHRGGGCKKLFRSINFFNFVTKSIFITTLYDPYRSSFISLSFDFVNKRFYYFLASQCAFPGSIFLCNPKKIDLFFGNRTLLLNFFVGNFLYNLSLNLKSKAKYCRAAGTFCQIIQQNIFVTKIRIPSGKVINLDSNIYATLGRVSNIKHNLIVKGNAGSNRLRGFRPIVRGIAMNPVDHPHGGRTNGGQPSATPWGLLTKGKPTVKKKYE